MEYYRYNNKLIITLFQLRISNKVNFIALKHRLRISASSQTGGNPECQDAEDFFAREVHETKKKPPIKTPLDISI